MCSAFTYSALSMLLPRLKCLSILQRRAVRIAAKKLHGITCRYWKVLSSLSIFKFDSINKFVNSIFMFRCERKLLLLIFNNYFKKNIGCHAHFTEYQASFYSIFARTNTRSFAFKTAGPAIWNSLPMDIPSVPGLRFVEKMRQLLCLQLFHTAQ